MGPDPTVPQAPTLAIDIGASHTRLALVAGGTITARAEHETPSLSGHRLGVAEGIVPAADRFLDEAGRPGLVAAGVGVAASVDASGSILQARGFGVPAGPLLRDAVGEALGIPVVVENDANLAALAEQRYGAARDRPCAAVITLGTNIGLGLILDGRLYRGAHGSAGEAGLLLVPVGSRGPTPHGAHPRRAADAGPLGATMSAAPEGYAWIEELVGGGALAAAAGGRELMAAPAGDPDASAVVDRAIEGWALVIADLAAIVDPEVVVLVGGLAVDAAHLIPRLQRRVAELVAHGPEVCLGTVGPDAQLLGADLLARAALAAAANHARAGLSAHSIGGRP